MLELKNIVLQRGKKVLLDHASARIERNNRVGLIGRNGAGKSSLMQVLTGHAQEDGGDFHCDIKSEKTAHLEQSLPHSDLSAIEFVKTGDHEWHTVQQRLQLAEASHDGVAIAECHAHLQDIDGYTIDARAATILHGLGFSNEQILLPINTFSGGWQMRLQLAKVLLSRADLLLLDEPTNHLDLEAIAWFEKWLLSQPCNVILISHDRDFLDNVCSQILHLAHQKLKLYSGNYTDFIKQYELQLEVAMRQREAALKKRAHMQSYVDRFRAKASKAKQAQSRLKAISKLAIAPAVQQENPFHFSFFDFNALSSPIIKLDARVGYPDKTIFKHANISLMNQDRIGLIGLNGAGKTTLIKTLVGELALLSGELTKHQKLNIGYFSQQQLDALDYDNSPIGHMLKQFPRSRESEMRSFLGGFNFSGDRVFDKVKQFSGGEKARLALALLIYNKPNVLLLDEPTNHLDIQMREALIFALQEYNGAVIVVSHDRYFINSIVDTLWLANNGEVHQFKGNLDDYQKMILDENNAPTPKQQTAEKKTKKQNPQNIAKLEKRIETLSGKVKKIEDQLADSDVYLAENASALDKLQQQHEKLKQQLDDAESQWLENS
ncbi:MAG: ATP-binding cassette domain-containing protein [Gammaproteobacteria bacterium]|nr:ATP-binding cassette domain-containing protein [Gammaproteobacteria bacterium]MCH9744772.1 ATP-binding cassette domain-containing protein [Gammaproteobacteria bacterium]